MYPEIKLSIDLSVKAIVSAASIYQMATVDDPVVKSFGALSAAVPWMNTPALNAFGIFTGVYSAGVSQTKEASAFRKTTNAVAGIVIAMGSSYLLNSPEI